MDKLFLLQNELQALSKDQDNPFFKSKYFDVNKVIEHLKPLLEKQELLVLQPLCHIEGKMALKTEVWTKDGKLLVREITPLPEASDAQKYGSAITYFRRYALQSLFLLQAEDDDGNTASHSPRTPLKQAKIDPTKVALKDDALDTKLVTDPNNW